MTASSSASSARARHAVQHLRATTRWCSPQYRPKARHKGRLLGNGTPLLGSGTPLLGSGTPLLGSGGARALYNEARLREDVQVCERVL
jgi:hypothetical protein